VHPYHEYKGYTDVDLALFERFRNPPPQGQRGFVTDFLGSRIRVSSLWDQVRFLDGQVLPPPFPVGDFHAETIEWIGLLKCIGTVRDRFTAAELGAGFGPWAVAGGVAARRSGIQRLKLYAVEADPQHFGYLQQHFSDNGFAPADHVLINGAVGVEDGVAHWPAFEDSRNDWGSRPLAGGKVDHLGREFSRLVDVPVISLQGLLSREQQWDLVHMDVQGTEAELCRSCLDLLDERVRWLILATHSRQIEGELIETFYRRKWILENEKPARFTYHSGAATIEAMTVTDGTQVWRNPSAIERTKPST
jgi:FkbM family methyltransferase